MAEHYTPTEKNFIEFYENYVHEFSKRTDLPFRIHSITFEENAGPSSVHGITLSSPKDESWKARHLDGFVSSNLSKCRFADERKQEILRCVTDISRLVNLLSYRFDEPIEWQPARVLKVRKVKQASKEGTEVDTGEFDVIIPFEESTPRFGMIIRNEHVNEISWIWKAIDDISENDVKEIVWRSIDLFARGQRSYSVFNRFTYFWDSIELVVNFWWELTRLRSDRTDRISKIMALSRGLTEENCLEKARAICDVLETPWCNKVDRFLKFFFPPTYKEMMSAMDRLYDKRNAIVHTRLHESSLADYESVEAQIRVMKKMSQELIKALMRGPI